MLVGRLPECSISVPDPWVSAHHARLENREGTWWVVDLQSRNGTFVNGQRIKEAPLQAGLRLSFGKTDTEVRPEPSREQHPVLDHRHTVIQPLIPLEPLGGKTPQHAEAGLEGMTTGEFMIGPSLVAHRQIAVLNELGKALTAARSLDEAEAAILSTTAQAVRAERAALLLLDREAKLSPAAFHPPGSRPRLSSTLVASAIQTALEQRVGLIILDAQQDERFMQAKSVVAEGIRSCMCVPVWSEERILGMLVLDRSFANAFSAEDLQLATMVGYQAALAIDRARFLEQAQHAETQRQKLLRHFSPDVANLILSQEQAERDPLELRVHEEVTVLFADISGFTSLTERLAPLELGALLRSHFQEMSEAIFENGGTLDKFVGDGVMAIFGAPVPNSRGARSAASCALSMLARINALNARLPADRQLAIRIGINTGRVIAGNVGSPERLEFTVLGDSVNTASRLESIAKPGRACVGPLTYALTADAFVYRPLGATALKGKADAVEVYELVSTK